MNKNKGNLATGKRQKGQTTSHRKRAEDLVVTHLQPPMLKNVDMRKLALNLPCRQLIKKRFTNLPTPAGLFSQLGSGLRLRIFALASTYSAPFRIHSFRGNGKLAHGPYHKNNLTQVADARALSAVSRAVRHETNMMFYRLNTFNINHDPHRSGNDATSVLKRFRETIGEEAFSRIRALGFIAYVSNERASQMLPPPQDLCIQITEALKAMIIAGGIYSLEIQSVSAKLEVCIAIDGHHSHRNVPIDDNNLVRALEYKTRFMTSVELSLRLAAYTWERHLARWMKMADEAAQNEDEVKRRGISEVVVSMSTARERLRTMLPLQSRI